MFLRFLVSLCLVATLAGTAAASPTASAMNLLQKSSDRGGGQAVHIAENASPAELKAMLAGMTDDQLRKLLVAELERRETEPAPGTAKTGGNRISSFIDRLHRAGDFVRNRFIYLFEGAGSAPRAMPEAYQRVFGLDRSVPPEASLAGVALLTAMYALAAWMLRRRTGVLRVRLASVPENPTALTKLGRLFLRALLDVMCIALLSAAVFILYLLFVGEYSGAKPVVITWLAAMILWGLSNAAARFILAPRAPALRFLPIPDHAAQYMYKWAERFGLLVAASLLACGLLRLDSDSEALHLLTLAGVGLLLTLLLCVLIIKNRQPVAEYMRSRGSGGLQEVFAGIWHLAAVSYLLLFWVVWVLGLILFGAGQAWNGLAAMLCVPLFLIFNWMAQRLVSYATDMAGEHDDPVRIARVRAILSGGFRIGIAAALFFWLLSLYDVNLPLGEATARALLNVMVTLVLAYIFWLFVSAAIERRIQPDEEEAEEAEGEGGHGGDRLSTLLHLLKRFIFAALVVVVALIVLSSIGVDIGPLLAGASIFGIAIGFGSQTLVKDIVSGIFFLLDDAIRVGDYLEVGSAKGTVERISIRSMQLRHHLGMVYTIPFGNISQVKNMTRDYSIMKLEYHVPFDTDIGQVKKIVKKIDKEIREIPEFDSVLLSKIKSQGVKRIDEVGMLMRIKFTTKPGGQFSVRKAVLAKLRKKFEDAGLQFAHRKVTVHVAHDEAGDAEAASRAGAAAAQQILDEEQNAEPGASGGR